MNHKLAFNAKTHIVVGSLLAVFATGSIAESARDRLMEEVVVTATKKNTVENVQDVAIAISAFGESQLDALKIQDISDISLRVPNVDLSPVGTSRGTARFSIRGWAPTSSIVSIDPTVGTIVDGLYLPSNVGVVYDTFDLESIEVLRGPQGVLFGRNVVGGVVLINTKKPTDEFEAQLRVKGESGFRGTGENMSYSGIVTGPLTDNLRGKIAVYHNKDEGWFKNEFNGQQFDANETTLIRAALAWDLGDSTSFLLSYENGDQDGDGQPNQSHDNRNDGRPGLFDRDDFKVTSDLDSFQRAEWDQVIFTTNIDVNFGDGTITNITGWRAFENRTLLDIDALDISHFNSLGGSQVDSFSNELRYFGTFGDFNVTTGLYFLKSEIINQGNRTIAETIFADRGLPPLLQNNSGVQDAKTFGVFVNTDYDVTDRLTLSLGMRYTDEEKEATSAALRNNTTEACGALFGPVPCINDIVDDSDSWYNFSYKAGFTFGITDSSMIYGHISRSYRAGGYNLRRASVDTDKEPFDEEQIDQLEIGAKMDLTDDIRLNVTSFYSVGKDLQRELIVDPVLIFQEIANTADADIYGIELDSRIFITDQLSLLATIGYLHAEYTDVLFDLNADGVLNDIDEDLDLPSVPEMTNSFSVLYDQNIGDFGLLSSQITYSHRDSVTGTKNQGLRNARDEFDINMTLYPNNASWELSLYGKNLTNHPNLLQDTPLGNPITTLSALGKGRRIGLEFRYNFN
ncbi:MAG: TonB-dependent receptor [Pseudomonadales bacterium]|nr:TonB-dependent receptor [Pseudomonadales bacterium]